MREGGNRDGPTIVLVHGWRDTHRVWDELKDDFYAVIDTVSPDAAVRVVAHHGGSVQVWTAVYRPGAEDRVSSFMSLGGCEADPGRGHRPRRTQPSAVREASPIANPTEAWATSSCTSDAPRTNGVLRPRASPTSARASYCPAALPIKAHTTR